LAEDPNDNLPPEATEVDDGGTKRPVCSPVRKMAADGQRKAVQDSPPKKKHFNPTTTEADNIPNSTPDTTTTPSKEAPPTHTATTVTPITTTTEKNPKTNKKTQDIALNNNNDPPASPNAHTQDTHNKDTINHINNNDPEEWATVGKDGKARVNTPPRTHTLHSKDPPPHETTQQPLKANPPKSNPPTQSNIAKKNTNNDYHKTPSPVPNKPATDKPAMDEEAHTPKEATPNETVTEAPTPNNAKEDIPNPEQPPATEAPLTSTHPTNRSSSKGKLPFAQYNWGEILKFWFGRPKNILVRSVP